MLKLLAAAATAVAGHPRGRPLRRRPSTGRRCSRAATSRRSTACCSPTSPARRVPCPTARRVARRRPAQVRAEDGVVHRARLLVLRRRASGPELRFARCSKPGGDDELFKTIRFEFGS